MHLLCIHCKKTFTDMTDYYDQDGHCCNTPALFWMEDEA